MKANKTICIDVETLEALKNHGGNASEIINNLLRGFFNINSTIDDLSRKKKEIEEKLNPLIMKKEEEEEDIKENKEKEEKEIKEEQEKELRILHINNTFLSEHIKKIEDIKSITDMGAIREIFTTFKKECPELDWRIFYKEFQN